MTRKQHPTKTVLTGPLWLKNIYDGHTEGNSMIKPIEDPDGNWILGKEILTDPKWDLTTIVGTSPDIQKPISDYPTS